MNLPLVKIFLFVLGCALIWAAAKVEVPPIKRAVSVQVHLQGPHMYSFA
jgi:hypothetical protein